MCQYKSERIIEINKNIFESLKTLYFEFENCKKINQRMFNIINYLNNHTNFDIYFGTVNLLKCNDKGGYYTFNCKPVTFNGNIEDKFHKMKRKGKRIFIFNGLLFEHNSKSLNELLLSKNNSLLKAELLNHVQNYIVNNWDNLNENVRIL